MNPVNAIPSRSDIDVHGSLDEVRAAENFEGKSLEEAEMLFRANSIDYQEGLMWMGPVAFRFYIRAAAAYTESEHAINDADIINCLAETFFFRLEHEATNLIPCAGYLAGFCAMVVRDFERYGAESEIYGNLRDKYQRLAGISAEWLTHREKSD